MPVWIVFTFVHVKCDTSWASHHPSSCTFNYNYFGWQSKEIIQTNFEILCNSPRDKNEVSHFVRLSFIAVGSRHTHLAHLHIACPFSGWRSLLLFSWTWNWIRHYLVMWSQKPPKNMALLISKEKDIKCDFWLGEYFTLKAKNP